MKKKFKQTWPKLKLIKYKNTRKGSKIRNEKSKPDKGKRKQEFRLMQGSDTVFINFYYYLLLFFLFFFLFIIIFFFGIFPSDGSQYFFFNIIWYLERIKGGMVLDRNKIIQFG